jgi:hypothetical protein
MQGNRKNSSAIVQRPALPIIGVVYVRACMRKGLTKGIVARRNRSGMRVAYRLSNESTLVWKRPGISCSWQPIRR